MGSCLGVGISTYPGLCSVIIIKLLSAGQEGQEEAFATNSHDIYFLKHSQEQEIHTSPAPVC